MAREKERHKRELEQMRKEVYTHTRDECMETMRSVWHESEIKRDIDSH